MQDLKVIGVENGALVAVGDDGERFRIAVDEALQSKVRQVRQETPADAPKLSPREVQAHIRSGMSAEDVAAVTGAPLDYVQLIRFAVAKELVTQSRMDIERVAAKAGFRSAQQLRRVWSRWEPRPPSAYRNSHAAAG